MKTSISSDPKCIFCQVANGQLPSTRLYEDEDLLAILNIKPEAPVHLLIIPKAHLMRSVAEMTEDQSPLLGRMVWIAKQLAEQQGIDQDGYRLVFNIRHHAGQETDHLHLHLLGGRQLGPVA